jgi:hypothetical protein
MYVYSLGGEDVWVAIIGDWGMIGNINLRRERRGERSYGNREYMVRERFFL